MDIVTFHTFHIFKYFSNPVSSTQILHFHHNPSINDYRTFSNYSRIFSNSPAIDPIRWKRKIVSKRKCVHAFVLRSIVSRLFEFDSRIDLLPCSTYVYFLTSFRLIEQILYLGRIPMRITFPFVSTVKLGLFPFFNYLSGASAADNISNTDHFPCVINYNGCRGNTLKYRPPLSYCCCSLSLLYHKAFP